MSLFNAINQIAERYDMPILYSCHPRSKKRLEASNFQLNSKVIQHEPLGFHDYNCLQMHAFAVVSDSGTLPEESSLDYMREFLHIRKGIRCLLLSVKLTAENMKRNIKI